MLFGRRSPFSRRDTHSTRRDARDTFSERRARFRIVKLVPLNTEPDRLARIHVHTLVV